MAFVLLGWDQGCKGVLILVLITISTKYGYP
jgi:hypothetical protein